MVFQAAREDGRSGKPALGRLMERYWQPLYFFARRQGLSAVDAEDATQTFLMELLDGKCLAAADPAKGRFRNYLLTLWKRFLIDRERFNHRIKRGGEHRQTSLSCIEGEKAWLNRSTTAAQYVDPDQAYYEQWAAAMIDAALQQLRLEYSQSRRETIFEALMPHLTVPIQAATYRAMALQLNCSEGAIKVAMHRLRQRFAETLRQQVQETLDDPRDLETELEELIRYFPRQAK
ncbi:MAG: sigma-70 family RNA polymerase sigma factor [Pirellulaceae bacterium]|nr:sigma-70 family RNA polymerase sigma factor [Pirellulaceae bacterium]